MHLRKKLGEALYRASVGGDFGLDDIWATIPLPTCISISVAFDHGRQRQEQQQPGRPPAGSRSDGGIFLLLNSIAWRTGRHFLDNDGWLARKTREAMVKVIVMMGDGGEMEGDVGRSGEVKNRETSWRFV